MQRRPFLQDLGGTAAAVAFPPFVWTRQSDLAPVFAQILIESGPTANVSFSADIAVYRGNPVVAFIENDVVRVKRFVP